jgi:hypothetical protein
VVGGVDGRLQSAAAGRLRYPISRPRTPTDTLRARIEAHFGTIISRPIYPGCFAAVPTAVTYFTGF